MNPQLESIASRLKSAREIKGLSQRALGQKVGLPQSHISKIESAEVDLQTTSLMELARALDLELALVPREAMAIVRSWQRADSRQTSASPIPAYRLDEEEGEGDV